MHFVGCHERKRRESNPSVAMRPIGSLEGGERERWKSKIEREESERDGIEKSKREKRHRERDIETDDESSIVNGKKVEKREKREKDVRWGGDHLILPLDG